MKNFFIHKISIICLIYLFIYTSTPYAESLSLFEQGKIHFNNKNYQSAIHSFQSLLNDGDQRATIFYNLAVSQYKINEFSLAEKTLKSIINNPQFSDIAAYNIGLINIKVNNYNKAKTWFSKVNSKTNPDLYQRAQNMIQEINSTDTSFFDKVNGLLLFTLGSDDNVNRVGDTSPSNISDTFFSTYISGLIPLNGTPAYLEANHYAIKYSDLSSNNYDILRINIGYKQIFHQWKTKSVVSYASSKLGSRAYQDNYRFSINTRLKLNNAALFKASYKYDKFQSAKISEAHLDGWAQQVQFAYKMKLTDLRYEARYKLELNNRADKTTDSYSPTRHSIKGIIIKPISDLWSIGTKISYRISEYPDVSLATGRTEKRKTLAALIRYKPNNNWTVESKFQTTSNESDVNTFDYSRKEIVINTSYNY